jgi:hypothetical protein
MLMFVCSYLHTYSYQSYALKQMGFPASREDADDRRIWCLIPIFRCHWTNLPHFSIYGPPDSIQPFKEKAAGTVQDHSTESLAYVAQ